MGRNYYSKWKQSLRVMQMYNVFMESNISLKPYNSLQVEVQAKYFTAVHASSDLGDFSQMPVFVLGGGCNTLFTKDWPGLVLKNDLLAKEIVSENDHEV